MQLMLQFEPIVEDHVFEKFGCRLLNAPFPAQLSSCLSGVVETAVEKSLPLLLVSELIFCWTRLLEESSHRLAADKIRFVAVSDSQVLLFHAPLQARLLFEKLPLSDLWSVRDASPEPLAADWASPVHSVGSAPYGRSVPCLEAALASFSTPSASADWTHIASLRSFVFQTRSIPSLCQALACHLTSSETWSHWSHLARLYQSGSVPHVRATLSMEPPILEACMEGHAIQCRVRWTLGGFEPHWESSVIVHEPTLAPYLNSDEAAAFVRFARNAIGATVQREGIELATEMAQAAPLLTLPPAVFKDWIKLIQVSEKVSIVTAHCQIRNTHADMILAFFLSISISVESSSFFGFYLFDSR